MERAATLQFAENSAGEGCCRSLEMCRGLVGCVLEVSVLFVRGDGVV